MTIWTQYEYFGVIKKRKQEGHDGPEIAHLYIGPRGGANFNPGAFI
jgi:hypothetical protein